MVAVAWFLSGLPEYQRRAKISVHWYGAACYVKEQLFRQPDAIQVPYVLQSLPHMQILPRLWKHKESPVRNGGGAEIITVSGRAIGDKERQSFLYELVLTGASVRLIDEFVKHCLQQYVRLQDNPNKLLRHWNWMSGQWKSSFIQVRKTRANLFVSRTTERAVFDDLERFLQNAEQYKRLGHTYKRGYLFYGPSGTGKTSMSSVIADRLHADIYNIVPSMFGTRARLMEALQQIPPHSVLLIDEIDHYPASCGRARPPLEAPSPEKHKPAAQVEQEKKKSAEQAHRVAFLKVQDLRLIFIITADFKYYSRISTWDLLDSQGNRIGLRKVTNGSGTSHQSISHAEYLVSDDMVLCEQLLENYPALTPLLQIVPQSKPYESLDCLELPPASPSSSSSSSSSSPSPQQQEKTGQELQQVDLHMLLDHELHGCVTVATSNHPERLAPELLRGGRFDVCHEFQLCDGDTFSRIVRAVFDVQNDSEAAVLRRPPQETEEREKQKQLAALEQWYASLPPQQRLSHAEIIARHLLPHVHSWRDAVQSFSGFIAALGTIFTTVSSES
jgi:SpoVK/Ycf46/Vps4 family AAA+-type ATPase